MISAMPSVYHSRKERLFRHRDLFQGRTSGDRGFSRRRPAGEGRVITCEYHGFFWSTRNALNAKGDLSRLGYRHRSWDPTSRITFPGASTKPVVMCGDLKPLTGDRLCPQDQPAQRRFTDEAGGISNHSRKAFSTPSAPLPR